MPSGSESDIKAFGSLVHRARAQRKELDSAAVEPEKKPSEPEQEEESFENPKQEGPSEDPSEQQPSPVPASSLRAELNAAIRRSTDADVLHAYNIGVVAAIESMVEYWARRAALRHVSRPEKLIYRREKDRLGRLAAGARGDLHKSQRLLRRKSVEKVRLIEELIQASAQRSDGRKVLPSDTALASCINGSQTSGSATPSPESTVPSSEAATSEAATSEAATRAATPTPVGQEYASPTHRE